MNILRKNLLLEEELKKSKGEGKGCLMLDFAKKIKNWKEVLSIIEPSDLYNDETKSYGFESEPHTTVLFGFENSVTASDIETLFEDINQFVKIRLMGISIFESDKPYDVVKFTIQSDDLVVLHNLVKSELPNTESHPGYSPHMTIAYVKKGTGKRYVKEFKNPIFMEGNTFIYSTAEKHKTEWKIKKKYKYELSLNENNITDNSQMLLNL